MLQSYGITAQNNNKDIFSLHLEELATLGYSVIPDVLSVENLEVLRQKIDETYQLQVKEIGGEDILEKIAEKNLVRMPLCYDKVFVDLAANPFFIELVRKVLGSYFNLHLQNAIINMPNEKHHQSSWHRDLPYQNFKISKPLAVNILVCIDDFTKETGGTYILPFSHHLDIIPTEEYILKHSVQVHAKAGSVILMDSMALHRAGYNSSTMIRRAINHVYVSGIIRQQMNIPAMLNGKYSEDTFLRMLLGYDNPTFGSVKEFRQQRINRLK
jgi:ectoine hydroxylase-related dioxygenase (phytanoyl-CoA dioxygenase family)